MSIGSSECKREYSQNRLRRRLLRRLLARSSIVEGDLVYDIGAGDGVISAELARRRARVVAIEKDGRLFPRLKRRLGDNPRVQALHGDFLSMPLPAQARYKVFANIPFILTADIVRRLLLSNNPPEDCYLVMQKEAAERFAGSPRTTLFSLLFRPRFEFSILHSFRDTDFFPVPTIDIALLRIRRMEQALVTSEQAPLYRLFLVHAFLRGKPTVQSALKGALTRTQLRRLSASLGFQPGDSPRSLSFEQWLGLFSYFSRNADGSRRACVVNSASRLLQRRSHTHRARRRL
jgi:23S rRNA (adenine-N6)-dimethyltransferase